MTIEGARKILGKNTDQISDEQLRRDIDALEQLARVFIAQYERQKGLQSSLNCGLNEANGVQAQDRFFDGRSDHLSDLMDSTLRPSEVSYV